MHGNVVRTRRRHDIPCPKERWEKILPSGEQLTIRAACDDDGEDVRAFLESLSPDSRWLRYHSPAPIIRSWMVQAVTDADHQNREALVAIVDGRIVGLAEWGRFGADQSIADVGVVVDDRMRRRGIGRELLRHLAASGRAHGLEAFSASVLSVNRPTIALVQDVAPQRTLSFDGPTVAVHIPLSA
jgi:ribosomal protein S18 acetylase RimI-like enzyme